MITISIGNFEGVHRGHAALLSAARQVADAAGPGGQVVAVTFDPLPAEVLRPGTSLPRLCEGQEKAARLRASGADEVLTLPTSPGLLALDPAAFVARLREQVAFEAVVEGPDFRFGRGRGGDIATLTELGRALGFTTAVVPEVEVSLPSGPRVAARSSLVRRLLGLGRVLDASAVLGRPYELGGLVVPGDQQGRLLGCPTANLDHGRLLLPGDGVYAGHALLPDGRRCRAAISVGCKPTFEPTPPRCEVHLLGIDLPLDHYGWPLRVQVERWIRGQLAFPAVEPLIEQMQRDLAAVDRILELIEREPSLEAA